MSAEQIRDISNPKPIKGAYKLERGARKAESKAHWLGRKHSEESKTKMRASAKAGWAAGKHDALKKPVDRPTVCQHCSGPFLNKSRGRILGRKYCSTACNLSAMKTKAAEKRAARQRVCPKCGASFGAKWMGRTWQRFCSPKCKRGKTMGTFQCGYCAKNVVRLKSQVRRHRSSLFFCSRLCLSSFYKGELHPMYRACRPEDLRRISSAAWKKLAKLIRERDGHKCLRCGRERVSTERQFPVDHIVPWRSFEDKTEADSPVNLVTLCPRCHSWKTSSAERQWFKGDVIAFEQYRRALRLATQTRNQG